MIISLGYNCYNAMALKKIIKLQPSLPFDSIQNHNPDSILHVYKILQSLKDNQLSIKDFITVNNENKNIFNFSLNHFYKIDHIDQYIDKEEKLINLYDIFTRRFARLKTNFFNQHNLLFYKPKELESLDTIEAGCEKIIELNPSNKIIVLNRTAPRRQKILKLNANIEFIRCGRSSQRTESAIQFYLTEDVKEYYKNIVL